MKRKKEKNTEKLLVGLLAVSMVSSSMTVIGSAESTEENQEKEEKTVKIAEPENKGEKAIPNETGYSKAYTESALNEKIPIYLDGKELMVGAYLIDSTTYVPLRAFCDSVSDCEISWNGRINTATVKKPGLFLQARVNAKYISANERFFYTVKPILNLQGHLYIPIRPLARAFTLNLEWNSETRSVHLETTGKRLMHASEVYNEDDIYWLSRIINAEAGGEPFDGKIAVGNVVLNRVRSKSYPNTIYGVIFDRKYGTQFSPVSFGTIYNEPNAHSIIAAKICLEGYSLTDRALYFLNPDLATNFWIVENCHFEFSIGTHDFYS